MVARFLPSINIPMTEIKRLSDQLILSNQERTKLEAELILVNIERDFQNEEKSKRASELLIANRELVFQNSEKEKRAAELIIAYAQLELQSREREKRAAELIVAGAELIIQNQEKEKRAAELVIANKALIFQNYEKEKRAAELVIANEELIFQNYEKEKRAAELVIANEELIFQNHEKEKRAAELVIANDELVFQNQEKENRAAELVIANKELIFQNQEKGKRAAELILANIALDFRDEEKEKQARELTIALKELGFQDEEKGKRAAELIIANRELLVQKLEKERRAAAEAKKDEFLNMVSHEFKTPLTNIKAINQVLEKTTNKTDKNYRFILDANQSIRRLEKLIEDLLDVTRINAGQIKLNIAQFYFPDALSNSIADVKQLSHKHEIRLENSVDINYTGDQSRIEQVLTNVLSNAVKYSPEASEVLVTAEIEAEHIVIKVQDFGLGIEKKNIGQLFQRFYRVSETAQQFQGVGLGLFIADEIVKKHQGSLSVESEPGKGTTFYCRLPMN